MQGKYRENRTLHDTVAESVIALCMRPSACLPSRSELVCRVKYGNSLPDIPFDPKFIAYPFEVS